METTLIKSEQEFNSAYTELLKSYEGVSFGASNFVKVMPESYPVLIIWSPSLVDPHYISYGFSYFLVGDKVKIKDTHPTKAGKEGTIHVVYPTTVYIMGLFYHCYISTEFLELIKHNIPNE